jgi:AraC-like DNA-binding protein
VERSAALTGLRHELGGYREYHPPPALARFAESVWVHRAPAAVAAAHRAMHRVLPDPALNLAFRCRRGADGRPDDPRLVVIGPKTRPFIFRFQPGHEIAAVKLKLEWAELLLGLAPGEHHDLEHDLSLASPRVAAPLLGILVESRSAGEAVASIGAALLQEARRSASAARSAAARALDFVRESRGRLNVDLVVAAMGASPRHLRRSVRREAAISLKAYARIVRLNHAMAAADRTLRPAWARIAAESGFFDQSHLVRECRSLTGQAPSRLIRERRAQAEISNPG